MHALFRLGSRCTSSKVRVASTTAEVPPTRRDCAQQDRAQGEFGREPVNTRGTLNPLPKPPRALISLLRAENAPHVSGMIRYPCVRNGLRLFGWGARIRTWEWRNQNPLPYHLATPHQGDAGDLTGKASASQQSPRPAAVLIPETSRLTDGPRAGKLRPATPNGDR